MRLESAVSPLKKPQSSLPNTRINMLLQQIKTVGGHVMGSAYSRAVLRTQIHALVFNQGLPSIFMTINPADIHSRIALYFAGIDLDLDKILPQTIPSPRTSVLRLLQHIQCPRLVSFTCSSRISLNVWSKKVFSVQLRLILEQSKIKAVGRYIYTSSFGSTMS